MGWSRRLQMTPTTFLILISLLLQVTWGQQWSNPNGQIRPIRNANYNCGQCGPGFQREPGTFACGRCVPDKQSCAPGFVLVGNQCSPCPCPGQNSERRFGTACRVDKDGQITCDCPDPYTGRDCSECLPGAVKSNQYPYNCIRVNQTSGYCPPGNYCPPTNVPQIIAQPPVYPPQIQCPTTGYQAPGYQVPWPKPNPIPTQLCPVQLPGPGPILCPTIPQQPQIQCPVNPAPQYPPQIQCPPINQPCPYPVPQPCPAPQPCPYPVPQPCPAPQPCPYPVPQPCPAPQPCPSPCPSPCPQIPSPTPCPPCPNPCQPCPGNYPCPQCPPCPAIPPCNPCPSPCPPCVGGGGCNVTCPNPCKDCPQCPSCNCNCEKCDGYPPILTELPCECDPRGTVSQYGKTCFCKSNVEGRRCNSCKPGYFGISSDLGEGCLQCWGSGVTSYCTAAVYYRTWIETSRVSDCSIELTDEGNTIIYNRDSNSKFSWDGKEARLSLSVSGKLYWSLPACFKGNRLTSYGAILRFSRMFTGSGANLGTDNDVIIVGGSGARLYFSSFKTQNSGDWNKLEVVLDERTHWMFFKNEAFRPATRFDMLEVLADVHMILIRATFTSATMSTSIKDVVLGSVSKTYTVYGFVLVVEQARCPGGYQGLSCESCAAGYYRDITDMTTSVFGACKLCPCGRNAFGCHINYGLVVCKCKPGFTGDRCQDREVITVTLDPFWVRDCSGTEIDFTCSFTTNSKRALAMRLGQENGASIKAESVTSISRTYALSSTLGRIRCEIVDTAGTIWALVYAAIKIEPCSVNLVVVPKSISIIAEEFICVKEGEKAEMSAEVFYYGPLEIKPEWFKEGENSPRFKGITFVIPRAQISDAGTYYVAATQGDAMDVKSVSLVVLPSNAIQRDDPEVLMIEGANNSTRNDTSTKPYFNFKLPPFKPPSGFNINSMQKDQAPEGYPSVVVDPTEVRAKPGETVTLHCNATGEEPMKFYWKSGTNDYIPVHVRVSRGALIFKSIKKEDEGSYYCVAWNNLGQVTERANIIVEDSPSNSSKPAEKPATDPLRVFVSKTSLAVNQGQNASLDCYTNYPNVKPMWSRKDGAELPKNSEVLKNGTLVIYRVESGNAGAYICKALGPRGFLVEVEAILDLNPVALPPPFSPPVVSLNPKSPVKGRSGENVRIECSAFGHPPPNITWSRLIEGSEKKLVTAEGNMTIYEIVHLTKSDEGKYTCTALNSEGTKSESLSLVVDDAIICKDHEFRCKSGDQCIPKEDRCDNERDCKDGSDEHHCRKRSRRSVL